jgi:hypothetical protein
MLARRHWLRRTVLGLVLAVVVIVLFWFSTVLAGLLVLGILGAALVTAEAAWLSRFGRNPYDYTSRKPRSGPWDGPH